MTHDERDPTPSDATLLASLEQDIAELEAALEVLDKPPEPEPPEPGTPA